MNRYVHLIVAALTGCACCAPGRTATVTFFDPSQIATLAAEGTTWDKVRSNGYYFTYTRDKLFTGGGPEPIGRYVRIPWPQGVEAQAVTAGPNPSKAKITIERVDGDIFDFTAFAARLLANTAGAGGAFEVVPFLDGEEVLPDPVTFDATGYYWSTFSYDTSPNPWGSTAPLTGYDKYTIDLYVDFALIGLTLEGALIPRPPGDYNQNGVVDAADYTVWRNTQGQMVDVGTGADGTGPGNLPDGMINRLDYDFWKANYGTTQGSGATNTLAVPEPTTLVMLLMGVLLSLTFPRAAASSSRTFRRTRR